MDSNAQSYQQSKFKIIFETNIDERRSHFVEMTKWSTHTDIFWFINVRIFSKKSWQFLFGWQVFSFFIYQFAGSRAFLMKTHSILHSTLNNLLFMCYKCKAILKLKILEDPTFNTPDHTMEPIFNWVSGWVLSIEPKPIKHNFNRVLSRYLPKQPKFYWVSYILKLVIISSSIYFKYCHVSVVIKK